MNGIKLRVRYGQVSMKDGKILNSIKFFLHGQIYGDIIQNSNILKCQWKPKPAGNPVGIFVTFQFLYIINEPAESGENDIPGGMNGNGS